MISKVKPITSEDFNKGLVTRSDFLKGDINASPNSMDVQWNYDSSLHKRLGYSSTNTVQIGSSIPAGWTLDTVGDLNTNLISYWKMDESSSTRYDAFGSNNLTDIGNVTSIVGIRNQAGNYISTDSQGLYSESNANLQTGNIPFSISIWTLPSDTSNRFVYAKRLNSTESEFQLRAITGGLYQFEVSSSGTNFEGIVQSISAGAIAINSFNHVVCWHQTGANAHIGISVNLSITTAVYSSGVRAGSGQLTFGSRTAGASISNAWTGRLDEVGFWKRQLGSANIANLYGGGTGNTYSSGASGFGWGMFDFGASGTRWLTVAAGTGLYASSNLGTTFVVIGTTRTQNYQSFSRSKNVLIATSDSYDPTLYWAGSAGTSAVALAPNSAPAAKFSINYQGFLILLNSKDSNGTISNRRFSYADENLQITDPWTNGFDIPSSQDDEITSGFILNKYLYISTRYTIYRVPFVGGNPDWQTIKMKDWGYVPRTVQIVSLKGGGQVAVGMDWDARIRLFDGFDDRYASDNIENDNGLCEFAMDKVSYAGSGLVVSHAALNPVTQEYRLNLAIGLQSTQVTHSIILNARNLAMYPYSNQNFQAMCVAESNNQRHLMAVDRSGYVHILDSGNLDVKLPINDVYDSPPLFSAAPEVVSKGHQLNLFFAPKSCGTIYVQDRTDLSNQWSKVRPLGNRVGQTQITGSENLIKVLRTLDVPSTYNTWQFRLTSSSGTANPWELDRLDFLQQGFGIGLGK